MGITVWGGWGSQFAVGWGSQFWVGGDHSLVLGGDHSLGLGGDYRVSGDPRVGMGGNDWGGNVLLDKSIPNRHMTLYYRMRCVVLYLGLVR